MIRIVVDVQKGSHYPNVINEVNITSGIFDIQNRNLSRYLGHDIILASCRNVMTIPMGVPGDVHDQALVALRRIVRSIDRDSKRLSQRHGITGPQALVMKAVQGAGGLYVGELAKRVNLSQATVTDILDRLEKRGLVLRMRSTSDRRRVLVRLTDAGARLVSGAAPLLQGNFIAEFKKLQDWEQTLILSSLQRVATMMDASYLDAAPILVGGPFTPDGRRVEEQSATASKRSEPAAAGGR